MALLSREQIKELIKERNLKSVEDVRSCLSDLFGETIQAMLEAEVEHHFGYEKNDSKTKNTPNRRNGHGTTHGACPTVPSICETAAFQSKCHTSDICWFSWCLRIDQSS